MVRRSLTFTILAGLVLVLVLAGLAGFAGEKKDIVDTAIADGRFETLVAALEAAELVDTLKGEGPYTVFAPTDDAFDKLPAGTGQVLRNDIPTLTDILLHHVVAGKVMAADVVNLTSTTTVLGEAVTISV